MKVYIAYSKDRYKIPIAIADSVMELAEITGKNRNGIESVISKWKKGEVKNPGYACVEVEDE